MSYRGTETKFNDFSGGLVTARPITELLENESSDLDNIVVFSKGRGFRSRFADTEFNSSAMNLGDSVNGLGYYKRINGDEFLVAISGNKIYSSTNALVGTMSDITGTAVVTGGQNNIWSMFTFNNNLVAFGGSSSSPDAPWTWTGSGNAAPLGGSPPSAYFGFQANNRAFALRTGTYPSRIFWSILGNAGDWTGTGSGYSDVSTSDNDKLVTAAVLNTNTVLLFKQNSIHQMQIGSLVSGAFPIFPLFKGTGCVGKHAIVVNNGLVYFITPSGKMLITDGSRIFDSIEIPRLSDIDDLWSNLNPNRLEYIQGTYRSGSDYEHIIWNVSYGSGQGSNNVAFIWDIENKCWLRNTTGYASNVMVTTQSGMLYGGHYNGKIYKKDSSSSTVTDASNSGAVVDGYLISGWFNNGRYETIKEIRSINLSFFTSGGGSIRFFYGFDFDGLNNQINISQMPPTGGIYGTAVYGTDVYAGVGLNMVNNTIPGRGNFFQYKIETPTAAFPMKINGFTMSYKERGQKRVTAR